MGAPLGPDVSLSPINFPSRENPKTIAHIPRKVLSRPSSSISDQRSSEPLPGVTLELTGCTETEKKQIREKDREHHKKI